MFKARIQEIVEFSKSESPYRKANKGWINQDVFLDLAPNSATDNQKKEIAKVTLLWSPINTLLSNIFLIIILCSLLVFTSIYIIKGGFKLDFIHISSINDLVKVDQNQSLNTSQAIDRGFKDLKIDKNIDQDESDKPQIINSLNDNLINSDQKREINKIDIQANKSKLNEVRKDTKIVKNKKSKSNFI